ncbi:hypothetical protein J7394_19815 [Ruegeria sp. R13_0]|uniref:sarcosine oxidase subunit gamma n=1 Tax=Ruegeria sp. R13_0 TaxID=2821099 RepID=UPI001AD9C162|nr:sarcosine oxidase subunit gamma family protein [Ruegeria sp. R13_0]MBO9436471.1 hypothetical protein [Ruegeria sp. R13_0]
MMLDTISPLGGDFGSTNALASIPWVTASERRDLGAVLITCAAPSPERIKSIGLAIGCSLPRSHGLVVECDGKRAIWLTPRSWLVLCETDDEARLLRSIASNFPDRSAHASRYSDALCWLSLEGAKAEELLNQGCFLSFSQGGLPVGNSKRTPVAGISAVILREAETVWTIGVERSRASYFVEWLEGLTLSGGE